MRALKVLFGFLLTCIGFPGLYAGLAYWYISGFGEHGPRTDPRILASLIAFPLAAAGVPLWWDVWVNPPPKLGFRRSAMSPTRFLTFALMWHSIAIVICVVTHLVVNQMLIERFREAPAAFDVPTARGRLALVETELAEATRRHNELIVEAGFSLYRPDPVLADPESRKTHEIMASHTKEQEQLSAQLGDYDSYVRFKAEGPGNRHSLHVLGVLWGASLAFPAFARSTRRYHSGQPITSG